jgi:hypothetical protein
MTMNFQMGQTAALGGAGLSSALGGLPLQPAGGLNLGLGGLGNSPLATALGLGAPGGVVPASTSSALEMQLLRALLARTSGAATDGAGGATAPPAAPAAEDTEARLRRLNDSITAALNNEMSKVQTNLVQTLSALRRTAEDVKRMDGELEELKRQIDRLNKKLP